MTQKGCRILGLTAFFIAMFTFSGLAQFGTARLGINGLTCSQCSRSVELSLRKLAFVSDVTMDLENTIATIRFGNESEPDFKYLAKAVTDAGFSVRFLDITFREPQSWPDNHCLQIGKTAFYLLPENKEKEPLRTVRVIGKAYSEKKELRKHQLPAAIPCHPQAVLYVTKGKD
jgi:copper chaperone CopZ